jgi:hypothetical protein
MNPMTTGKLVFLIQLQQQAPPTLISAYRYNGRGSKGRKGKGAGGVVEGSAPTFVTEEGGNIDGSDGGAGGKEQEEEQEDIRGGLGSSARSGIGGGKKQPQQQQARAHQPIASNAAFAASLFQVRSWSC